MLTIQEASKFASEYTGRDISESNISYLIQYGRIDKFVENNTVLISKEQIREYYSSYQGKREIDWKDKLGDDLNWKLSFDTYKESETTKHVHRLHPYKGKFIPQLVEYFLDDKTDDFKKQVYFKRGDIVLDPFCGSGTTLVQANELGMHAVGVDVSEFNTLISNCKIKEYDIDLLKKAVNNITKKLEEFDESISAIRLEDELLDALYIFNSKYFPSPEYRKRVYRKEINENEYGKQKEEEFLPIFYSIVEKYDIKKPENPETFLDKWYFGTARKEIDFVKDLIDQVEDENTKNILKVILSRTIRSCRATTHSDLATLIEPVYRTYYCKKHKKICKPLFTISKWWKKYSRDTVKRLNEFKQHRTDTVQVCFNGDSTTIDLEKEIENFGGELAEGYGKNKIKGIFSSPPYVGLIDYHEQHAYAYELFGFTRKDDKEIGAMFLGSSKEAQKKYVDGIASVLINSKKYLADDYEVFLVANDKFNIYPQIAELAGMKIVEEFKRPVLNRTEKDKRAYSEIIFRMKEK